MNDLYPLRVLFVDDDVEQSKTLAKLLEQTLAPASLEVFYVPTLDEGIKASHKLIPCIVFLDLQFGKGSWKETPPRINEFCKRSQIIVITQRDGAEVEMTCRKAGALAVFTKPKIRSVIEIVTWVVANIGLNWQARQLGSEAK